MADFFEYLEKGDSSIEGPDVTRDRGVKEDIDFIVDHDIDLNKIIECIKNKNDFCYQEYLNDKLSLGMTRNKGYNDFDKIIFNQENKEKFDVINKVFNSILENEILNKEICKIDKYFVKNILVEFRTLKLKILNKEVLDVLLKFSLNDNEFAEDILYYNMDLRDNFFYDLKKEKGYEDGDLEYKKMLFFNDSKRDVTIFYEILKKYPEIKESFIDEEIYAFNLFYYIGLEKFEHLLNNIDESGKDVFIAFLKNFDEKNWLSIEEEGDKFNFKIDRTNDKIKFELSKKAILFLNEIGLLK